VNSGGLEAQGQLNHRGLWSGRQESNPHPKFGNLLSLLVGRLRSCGQGVGEGVAKRHGQDDSFGALQPPATIRIDNFTVGTTSSASNVVPMGVDPEYFAGG
jgi:hypothetical protein